MIDYTNILFFFSVSAFTSICIILTKNWHSYYTSDTNIGIQKFHKGQIPRVGGISIFFGYSVGLLIFENEILYVWYLIGLSIIPCFLSGIYEDIKKNSSTKIRFIAIAFSAILFTIFTDYRIVYLDIWGVDFLLRNYFFSLLITVFAITGISNSINIIDGFNGLASGVVFLILSGFSLIAWFVGDTLILAICLSFLPIIFGFFIFNFPSGRLFLGDSGSYCLGFFSSCVAIMLPFRNPDISPWVSLLICSYPFIETIFSIYRKFKRKGHSPDQPDKVHLHMLIHRDFARKIEKKINFRLARNPIVSIIIWTFTSSSILTAILFYNFKEVIISIFILFVISYLIIYRKLSLNLKN